MDKKRQTHHAEGFQIIYVDIPPLRRLRITSHSLSVRCVVTFSKDCSMERESRKSHFTVRKLTNTTES